MLRIVAPSRRQLPRCAQRRAVRVQRRYARAVGAFEHPALVTLTVPNARTPEDLERSLGLLLGGFRELRRRGVWPKGARGLWSLEVTWSPEHGFHPHLHVVCDLPWVDVEARSAEWERLTGARAQPDVKRAITVEARAGLLREGIKYVAKTWELGGAPALRFEYHGSMAPRMPKLHFLGAILVRGKRQIVVTATTLESLWEKHRAMLTEAMAGIRTVETSQGGGK